MTFVPHMADMMIRSIVALQWRNVQVQGVRTLSYVAESLDQPIPGLKEAEGSRNAVAKKDFLAHCQISRLENGLRVASQEAYGQYSTVGGEREKMWL